MADVQSLLDLPIATVAVLASGYLGYRIAYVGRDKTHRDVDVIFCSLAFAAISQAALQFCPYGLPGWAMPFVAGASAVFAAAIWRKWLSHMVFRVLRSARISTSDHMETAWDTVRLRQHFAPTTYVIRRTDGSMVMCHKPEAFGHLKDGPCILGADGSVALFITDRLASAQVDWEPRSNPVPGLGYEMTYIPASEIAEIRITVAS